MSQKFSREMSIRVYEEAKGNYLLVTPSPEGENLVQLNTAVCEEFFGKFCLDIDARMARQLGLALIEVSDRIIKDYPEWF